MIWLRFLAYFALIAGMTALVVALESHHPGSLRLLVYVEPTDSVGTSEFSPVEIAQLVILVAAGALLSLIARDYPSQRPLAILLGGIALVCLFRELDYFLDRHVVRNAWQFLVGVSGALVIAYTYRHRRRLGIAFGRLWPSAGIVLLFAGATILFAVVRILASESFWQAVLGASYERVVVNAVDELVELTGYLLWFVGVIEYTVEVRAVAAREPEPVAVKRRRAQLARRRERKRS
jgi:hypothetical protein